jgi:uncharacterized repeat protein (TIGR01451 family)
MTIDKEGGEITEEAYITTDITLRVAGEKWHNVILTLYCGEEWLAEAEVLRMPGDPDEQAVTITGVTIDLLTDCYSAVVEYTPIDDPENGEFWGADPAWLIFNTEYGDEVRLHHTFNVRHEDTWIWIVDDFRPYLVNLPLTLKYTVSYTIDYANIGTGDATNVWIYDEIPAGTFLEYSNPVPDTIVDDTVGWNIGYVPSGGSGTIFVDISFEFTNVIVKNWYPMGKILENTATMDYHDTNGNLVDQPSDCVEVIVYVPSVLKKPKMTHYSPIFQGEGSNVPDNLVSQIGEGTTYLQDKYLTVYEEVRVYSNLGTSGSLKLNDEQMTFDYKIIHIYMGLDPYANEPLPDTTSVIEDEPLEIEIELPPQITIEEIPDIDFDAVSTISLEFTLYDEAPEDEPDIEVWEPTVTSVEIITSPIYENLAIIPELFVIYEPQEVQVSTVTVIYEETSEVPEPIQVPVDVNKAPIELETQEPEIVTIVSVEPVSVEQDIIITEMEQKQEENLESHEIAHTEAIAEAASKAYINSVYINLAVVWFVIITLVAGLFVTYELRKRR